MKCVGVNDREGPIDTWMLKDINTQNKSKIEEVNKTLINLVLTFI